MRGVRAREGEMKLSSVLYRASRATRDAEVLTGRNGPERLVKRVARRKGTRALWRAVGR